MSNKFVVAASRICRTAYSKIVPRFNGIHLCRTTATTRLLPTMSFYRANSSASTDGSEELAFLKEEIKLEKESLNGTLPAISGFKIATKEAMVTLTKTTKNETVTVEFPIISNFVDEMPMDGEENEPDMDKMEPWQCSLLVKIQRKGQSDVLAIRGEVMPIGWADVDQVDQDGNAVPPSNPTEEGYTLQMESVSILPDANADWTNTTYSVPAESCGELYDLFMGMLVKRGVEGEFFEQIKAFQDEYEHGLYINVLEKVQPFLKSS